MRRKGEDTMRKKGISIILTVCMMMSLATPAMAGGANIDFEVNKKTVKVGETIEIIITNDKMTVSGFGGYLEFDSSLLECTSVIGMAGTEATPEEGYLMPTEGKNPVQFMVYDTIANTNKDGIHSFAYVSTKDATYKAGTVSKLIFKAKKDGIATFKLTEDSSGKDAYKDVAKTQKLTIDAGQNEVQKPSQAPKPAASSENSKEYNSKIILQIGNKEIKVVNKTIKNDAAPVIVDSRTMVPIRVVVEALGGTADWNNDTRTVTLTIDDKVLQLIIDKEIPGFGTGAKIMDSRTSVPVRYVAEYVGCDVQWLADTQQIVIQK